MPETKWTENSQWILRSIDALYEAAKEHDSNLTEGFAKLSKQITDLELEFKDAVAQEVMDRIALESEVKNLKKETSRKTMVTNAIAFVLLATATVLINVLIK